MSFSTSSSIDASSLLVKKSPRWRLTKLLRKSWNRPNATGLLFTRLNFQVISIQILGDYFGSKLSKAILPANSNTSFKIKSLIINIEIFQIVYNNIEIGSLIEQ